MDETTFRILDVLSRNPSGLISINELTSQIQAAHGSAYYKNIYDKTQELARQGLLSITTAGRSSLISRAFSNYFLSDFMASMEFEKKRKFLEKRPAYRILLEELEMFARSSFGTIVSISLINPEKNARLNKLELLFLLHDLGPYAEFRESFEKKVIEEFKGKMLDEEFQKEIRKIYEITKTLGTKFNIKTEQLILKKTEFMQLAASKEKNPLQEMLASKICIFDADFFWATIKQIRQNGLRFETGPGRLNPKEIKETDLAYNLSRFGYSEFGGKTERGTEICLETIIIGLLLEGNARRIEAIPALLAKNSSHSPKPNYNLLIYLAQKYEVGERLAGLLEGLNAINPNSKTKEALEIFEKLKIKPIKANSKAIKEKMRLYHAI